MTYAAIHAGVRAVWNFPGFAPKVTFSFNIDYFIMITYLNAFLPIWSLRFKDLKLENATDKQIWDFVSGQSKEDISCLEIIE